MANSVDSQHLYLVTGIDVKHNGFYIFLFVSHFEIFLSLFNNLNYPKNFFFRITNKLHISVCACVCLLQTSRHRDYGAKQVYEAEHGVCQLCQFDAEAFYKRLRWMSLLNSDVEIQFWLNLQPKSWI